MDYIAEIYEELQEIRKLVQALGDKKRSFLETGIVPEETQKNPKKPRHEPNACTDDKMEEESIYDPWSNRQRYAFGSSRL